MPFSPAFLVWHCGDAEVQPRGMLSLAPCESVLSDGVGSWSGGCAWRLQLMETPSTG